MKHMGTVGIRALKQNASAVIARAAAGEVVTVTDRGRPVAQITPLPTSRLDQMIAAGLATAATSDLRDLPEPTPIPGLAPNALSEAILRERDEDWR